MSLYEVPVPRASLLRLWHLHVIRYKWRQRPYSISGDFIGTKRREHPIPKPSSKQGASMRNTCTIHCPTWLSLLKFPPNFSFLPPSSQPMTYNDQNNRYRFCFLGYLWYPITYTTFNSDLRVGDTASHSRRPSFFPYLNLALCFKEPKLWIYYTADKGS